MKILLFSLFLAVSFGAVSASAQTDSINIIPKPSRIIRDKEHFQLSRKTKIFAQNAEEKKLADAFNEFLSKNHGFKLKLSSNSEKVENTIRFYPPSEQSKSLASDEAYHLVVRKGFIFIYGQEKGRFYGLQSLMQLVPAEFEKKEFKIPALDILDQPRFKYRGMHLDVARHFSPVEFVKKYIDLMAQYKFNYFHWHLTDDQGWRIEIKKYPRLTEIGSRRKETAKGRVLNPYTGDGVPVEGFYTQEQIKDVIAYAKARYITVIPEIELPGHASAALAAYPNLGCKENYEYKVQTTWGIFKEVFCPKDETFGFLEDVLGEVINLFPDSPYIHIGGDEVLKDHWKESPFVQDLKTKNNLKDEHEVQSYFVQRIEKFINSRGKKIIGWDEILEGGLAPNATVMSWRGMKGGIEAAKAKHDVIMTPTDFAYLDYGQGDPKSEPIHIGGFVPLQKVYSFEPVPKELNEDERKYILGAQGNVWTEYMKTPDKIEYMVFPRMLAMAEVNWTAPENKNFDDFQARLSAHFARLDRQNVNYRIPEPAGLQNVIMDDSNRDILAMGLTPLNKNWKIFYTLDGSEPTEKSNLYEKAIVAQIPARQKSELKLIVVNEKGRKSVVYGSTIWFRTPLAPTDLKEAEQGVLFRTYAQSFASVEEIETVRPENMGKTKSIGLGQFREKLAENLPFAVVFEGFINVPKDEIYEFELDADDGAVLFIGADELINNDGIKDKTERKSQSIPLKKGYHRFVLQYFKGQGKWALGVRWGVKGQLLRGISESDLAREKN